MTRALLALALTAAAALVVAACGGGDDGVSGVETLSTDACAEAEYGGEGDAGALIVSDLPMQGDSAERSKQMVEAIRIQLEGADWKAGETNVAFQACDDSLAETGEWDEARCRDNAEAYAANEDVIGVIGTYNSGCAAEMIPILNEAPGDGLAMVSPGNTLICLTEPSPQCEDGQPGSLYPTKERNYARVVPNDAAQGAGLAQFASDQGIERPYILYAADDPTSQGQAETFRGAATGPLGMQLAGFGVWDENAPDYTALMSDVKDSGADAVLLAGLLEQNGAQLITDKVKVLGPNDGDVALLATDGFAQQATIDEAGAAASGMFASLPGRTPDSLTGPGKELVAELESSLGEGTEVELFAPYAAQAAAVVLDAIEAGPERAEVISGVFGARVEDGIVGSFRLLPTGDPSVSTISVSLADPTGERFVLESEVPPAPELVDAAREG